MRTTAKLFLILCGLCILFFPQGSQAVNEQWKYFGSNEKGHRFFYDSASVVYFSKDIVRVWTRELTSDAPTKRNKEINCSSKIIRDVQVITEKTNKAPHTSLTPSEWRAIENQPPMKELFKVLCR